MKDIQASLPTGVNKWLIILLLSSIRFVESSRSAPDIGICDTILNGQPVFIDCLSGHQNYCCNVKLEQTQHNVTKWVKRCCSESEFVSQNYQMYAILMFLTLSMFNVMVAVVLISFASIILTKKAAIE